MLTVDGIIRLTVLDHYRCRARLEAGVFSVPPIRPTGRRFRRRPGSPRRSAGSVSTSAAARSSAGTATTVSTPPYRLWIWKQDLAEARDALDLREP
jgi:hypothetical protein